MANDFSGDSNCKALWKLDSGALVTDSISTNTLTNSGVAGDTTNHKEGTGCGDFESGDPDYMYIADANLASGFPLKNDDANKVISVCGWIKAESYPPDTQGWWLYSKWNSGSSNKRSFAITLQNTSGVYQIRLALGYNSGQNTELKLHASSLSSGTWYHITVSYNNADKSYAIRVRDTDGGVVGTDLTGTATLDANKLSVGTAQVILGAFQYQDGYVEYFDGLIDEVVVFNDFLTANEATEIAQGTYGAAGGTILPQMLQHHGG